MRRFRVSRTNYYTDGAFVFFFIIIIITMYSLAFMLVRYIERREGKRIVRSDEGEG